MEYLLFNVYRAWIRIQWLWLTFYEIIEPFDTGNTTSRVPLVAQITRRGVGLSYSTLVVRPKTLKRPKLLCYLSQLGHGVEIKDLYSLWNIDHVSFSQINQVLCIMLIYGYKNWSMFSGLCKAWILKNSYYSTFVTFVSSNSKLPITSYIMPLPWTSKNIYHPDWAPLINYLRI